MFDRANQVLHVLMRRRDGRGEMEKITPTCSCGWNGKPHEAWEDLQMTMVQEQEAEHLRQVERAKRSAVEHGGESREG
jgi:hypothetical protein